jgi:hypothetical protein
LGATGWHQIKPIAGETHHLGFGLLSHPWHEKTPITHRRTTTFGL